MRTESRASIRVAVLALLPLLALGAPPLRAAVGTRLFSGVASAGGVNGTQWRSEVVLSNARAAASAVLLEIVPRNGTDVVASTTLTLGPGETRRLPDLYAAMGAPSGAGTLRVTGDALVWVRTYNQGASGTFGMDVPGVTESGGWAAGTSVLFPIQTPVDASREFRSNLLFTNLGTTRATLTLSAGAATRTVVVEPGTFSQIDGVGAWLGAPKGPSILSVVATGRWFGLVTSIDPVLGDPTGMRGQTTATHPTTVFPGVASAGGMNGTLWRSEARIYNPSATPRTVGLEILPRGGSSVAASSTLGLGPFEMKSLADVYAAVGAPSGAGALRVTGDVKTWVRTFNQGATATFGTDVPEVVPGVAYGAGAHVSFPVNATADVTTGFRSNFLVYNHEARDTTLTFVTAGSTKAVVVPAGSFVQQDNLGSYLGLPPGAAHVSVSADGRWSAIVTAIDPYLGDPTTVLGLLTTVNPVPTGPGVPAGALVSASIGAAGGSLTSSDGKLTLAVPAGALAATTTFTLQPFTNLAWGGIASAYEVSPGDVAFAAPARLTFRPAAGDLSSVSLRGIGIAQQDGDGYWYWTEGPAWDAAVPSVSVLLSRLGPAISSGPTGGASALREGLATIFRYRYAPVGDLWLSPSGTTDVETGKSQEFWVEQCFPPSSDGGSLLRERLTIRRLPASGGCSPYWQPGASISPKWSVDTIEGGNGTFGTIAATGEAVASYTAPAKAPSPDTVTVSAFIGSTATLSNVTLVSHAKIVGNDYAGTFTLRRTGLDQVAYTVKGVAELKRSFTDSNGTSFDMTGTVTIDATIPWFGYTCNCVDAATKPIPADTVFAIQRKPTLAQRWVMPGVTWNFRCEPGGQAALFGLPYFVAPVGDCSQQAWVPLADEKHLAGSFASACNPAFTVNGSWDLTAK